MISRIASGVIMLIGVDYVHNDVHVHYDLPADLGQPSWLSSPEGAPVSWEIRVTPRIEANGLLRLHAVIKEAGAVIQEATMIVKPGSSAKLDSGQFSLTLEPSLLKYTDQNRY